MQTFLPYPNYRKSARVLDRQRLGKQRVECLQIVNALTGLSNGWGNHPITRMWAPYCDSLILYGLTICHEWINRGYRDTVWGKLRVQMINPSPSPPNWLGDELFHSSHLSKDYTHYSQFGWREGRHLAYLWPDPKDY